MITHEIMERFFQCARETHMNQYEFALALKIAARTDRTHRWVRRGVRVMVNNQPWRVLLGKGPVFQAFVLHGDSLRNAGETLRGASVYAEMIPDLGDHMMHGLLLEMLGDLIYVEGPGDDRHWRVRDLFSGDWYAGSSIGEALAQATLAKWEEEDALYRSQWW